MNSLSTKLSAEFHPQWPLSPKPQLLSKKIWEWGTFWCQNGVGFPTGSLGTVVCKVLFCQATCSQGSSFLWPSRVTQDPLGLL